MVMAYRVFTDNGYIVSIMYGAQTGNVTEVEYKAIEAAIKAKPAPPAGFDYRLTTALEWELYELPVAAEVGEDEPATEADYLAALDQPGVRADE